LIRYLLTALGATEVVVSNDTVMQLASALVSVACAIWGVLESRRHAKLAEASGKDDDSFPTGGAVAAVVFLFGLLPAVLLASGCATVSSVGGNGSVTTTKTVDWTAVDYTVQKSVKYSVAAVLNNNPKYATAVAAINGGIPALFVGTPTEAGLIASIKAMNTGLDDNSTALIAGALKDAYDLYVTKTGKTTLLASDERVQDIVKAVSDGIAEGVALHNALAAATRKVS
jgi:hypothetical protein